MDTEWLRSRMKLFSKKFGGHQSFLWGHWYPCFGPRVTSAGEMKYFFIVKKWVDYSCETWQFATLRSQSLSVNRPKKAVLLALYKKSCSSIHPEFWMIVYLITCTFLLLHQFQTLLCSIIVRCCQQILDEFGRNSWFLVLFCKLHQFSELALYNNKNVTIEYAQRAN